MRKMIFMFVAIAAAVMTLSGKTVRRTLHIFNGTVPETETLAVGTMEFVYDYSYCVDTTRSIDEDIASDRMLLQIAPGGMSKFSSYKNLTVDSIINMSTVDQVMEAASSGKLSNGDPLIIYKNYPDGKLTQVEKVCQDWFRYEEDTPTFDWEFTDSVANVLGYECRLAKCTFRGREWRAFYAEDIPVMDGPWKLQGLPGLIMKAEDSKGEYAFECIGIKSEASRPITLYKVPYNVTGRKKFYDAKYNYEINPYAYFEATTGGHVTVTDEAGNPSLDAYDPIDLQFDYIERDWRE